MLRMGLLVGLGIRMWDWVVVVGSGELAVLLSLPLFALECWPLARSLAFIWKHTLPRKTKTTPTLILSFLSLSLTHTHTLSLRATTRKRSTQHGGGDAGGSSSSILSVNRPSVGVPSPFGKRCVRFPPRAAAAIGVRASMRHGGIRVRTHGSDLTHASSSSLVTPFLGSNKLTGGP